MSYLRPAILLLVCPAFAAPVFAAPTQTPVAAQAAADDARRATITHLEELLRGFEGPADTRIELALRLAVLYDDEAQALERKGQEALPAVLDACVDDPAGLDACAAAHAPPELATAERMTQKSLRVLRSVVTGAPNHARAEEATWLYARLLGEAGDPAAPGELRRLVRTWPQSAYAADAWLLLADLAFDADDAGQAAVAYQRAIAFPGFVRADYARYKLAWVWFNLDDLQAATNTMTLVVDSPQGTLRDEAINDQLRFFAAQGQSDTAEAWLRRRGLDARLPAFYDALATTLEAKGDRAGAVVSLRRSLSLVDNPTTAARVVGLLRAADDRDGALAELARMQRAYGPGSAWARTHTEDPGTTALLRTAATAWHTEARKLRTGPGAQAAYAAADLAYTMLAAENDPALRLAHAELQYATKQFGPAWEGYMAAARAGGKDAGFAATSAVFAAEALVKAEPANPAWTDAEAHLVAAVDLAARIQPDDPKVHGMQYRAGWLLYQNDRLDEAVARFATVIAADPSSRDAELAADLTLDALAIKKDWTRLATTAEAFAQSTRAPATLRANAARIADNARFAAIEQGSLPPLEKADAFLALARTPSANAALAAHNAAVLYRQSAHLHDAITAGTLAVSHTSSPTFRDDLRALAFDQESIADFAAAATTYERYAALDGAPLRADALRSAFLFRDATGDLTRAAINGRALLAMAPTPALRLELADVLDRGGDAAGALAMRQEVARDKVAPVELRLVARAAWGRTLGDPTLVYTEALALWDTNRGALDGAAAEVAREAAGEMALRLGEGRWTRYQALRVDGPSDRSVRGEAATRILAAQLQAKLTALQAVEADAQRVIDTGSARHGVVALGRVGAAYEGFARAIGEAPVPAELEGDAREIYMDGIIDRMWALHQRAIAAYTVATDQARAASIVDPAVQVASDRLAALSGAGTLPTEQLLPSRYTASGAVVASFER